MKTVEIVGHSFDCLPGHVSVCARGQGSSLRVALCDAVRAIFDDPRLLRKRVHSFKLAVVAAEKEKTT